MDHDYTHDGTPLENINPKKITKIKDDILVIQDEPIEEINEDPRWIVAQKETISVTSQEQSTKSNGEGKIIPNQPLNGNEISPTMCPVCNIQCNSRKSRTSHLKRVHNIIPFPQRSNIMCPLCRKKDSEVTTYEQLVSHIETLHKISIEKIYIKFASVQEYDRWKSKEKIKSSYCVERYKKQPAYRECHLVCNRSDTKGRTGAHASDKKKKYANLSKIQGICPSRLIVKFYKKGHVKILYWKTHVGHEIGESQFLRLTDIEKNWIVEKLKNGLPKKEIIEQAKQLDSSGFGRINLLNYNLIVHLAHKYNIENTTNADLLRSTTINVKRWIKMELDIAFFFKAKGQPHEILEKDDFGVGFMNEIMQEKLMKSPSIICIETINDDNEVNKLHVTILLIRDDDGTGFPAAFFISNRTDRVMLELYFKALKSRVGGEIQADFFFSNDDSTYYNAWVSAMEKDPHRFISTWHVLNNLEKEAKAIMVNEDLIKEVKPAMKQIMTEASREGFVNKTNKYLTELKQANEDDFLRYLFGEYFQEDRITMWAHWFRKKFDSNINETSFEMSQLKGKANTTAKKLLYSMETFDLNMWIKMLYSNSTTDACPDNVEILEDDVYEDEVDDQSTQQAIQLKREELHRWLDNLSDADFERYLKDTEEFRKEPDSSSLKKINIINNQIISNGITDRK